jgi:hypothetical protein
MKISEIIEQFETFIVPCVIKINDYSTKTINLYTNSRLLAEETNKKYPDGKIDVGENTYTFSLSLRESIQNKLDKYDYNKGRIFFIEDINIPNSRILIECLF